MSEIKIKRGTGFVGIIGKFPIFINDQKVGAIKNGDEAIFPIEGEEAVVRVGSAPMKTKSESSSSSESDQANNQAETGQEQNNGTSTEGTSAPRNGQWTTEGGNFTVNPGDTSEDVAQNLYDAGIISSPDVFLEVVEQWDLSTLLIAGTYELNSGMNVNTIAEISHFRS